MNFLPASVTTQTKAYDAFGNLTMERYGSSDDPVILSPEYYPYDCWAE